MTTTLHVRGAGGTQFLTWVLSDETSELGTAKKRLVSDTMEIDLRGRRLTARKAKGSGGSTELSVTDDATGRALITGTLRSSGDSPRYREWSIALPTGNSLIWFYQGEPRKLGFYTSDGTLFMSQGHDPSFDVPSGDLSGKRGTLRVLLSFWKGALASSNRYILHVADDAVGRVVEAADVPILALLGVWLQAEAEPESESSSGV